MARVFTVDEAAEYLHVTPYTIRKWLRKGKIPGRKIGRIYRILEAELEEVLQGAESYHIPYQRIRPGSLVGPHARQGWSTDDFLREKHEETREEERRWQLRQWRGLSKDEKLKRIDAVVSKYADARFSSDDLIRERREEVEREEQHWKEPQEQ